MADKLTLTALITGVDALSPTLAALSAKIATFRKTLDSTGLGGLGLKAALSGGELAEPFVAGVRAAGAFETAMVGVRLAVRFDDPGQFKAMGDDILKLSQRLPASANDLAKLVATGGQAGIARGELLGFAEDAVAMGVAFNQGAEQSGTMMATWRTAFKLTQAEALGLAEQIDTLGRNGRASGQQILDIVNRVGPLAGVAGNATGQVAALAATLAGTGAGPEQAANGIKQFMQALAAGSAATDAQRQAFQGLQLDSQQVAQGMQTDAQGTLMAVLQRVAAAQASQRPALLAGLFGTDAAAVAPLLANLDALQANLGRVGDRTQYAGALQRELAARTNTLQGQLGLMGGALNSVSVKFGDALLPAVTAAVAALVQLLGSVGDFIGNHPALVQGAAAAGMAFQGFRVAVAAASGAARVLGAVLGLSPIGLAAVAIAAAVGLIVANWGTIVPFFEGLWARLKTYAAVAWEVFKAVFSFSPLGLIIQQWEPLIGYFKGLLGEVGALLAPLFGDNEANIGQTARGLAGTQTRRGGIGGGDGTFVRAGAPQAVAEHQQLMNQSLHIPSTSALLSVGGGNARLDGELVIRLEGDTQGIRPMPATTNQPGLRVTTDVGRRTLSGGAHHGG